MLEELLSTDKWVEKNYHVGIRTIDSALPVYTISFDFAI